MAQITYGNKVAINENSGVADINKCNASDMNEIKSVVNTNDTNVGTLSNLSTIDKTSIVNAVNELETRGDFSTTEVVIGTWINSKPIYRKVVNKSVSSGSSSFPKSDVSSDMDQVLTIRGFVIQPTGNVAMIPYDASDNDKLNIYYQSSQSLFQVRAGSQYGAGSAYITIEYTKTTD